MKEKLKYVRMFLKCNGYRKEIITAADINNTEIDKYMKYNDNIWFDTQALREYIMLNDISSDTKLDSVF